MTTSALEQHTEQTPLDTTVPETTLERFIDSTKRTFVPEDGHDSEPWGREPSVWAHGAFIPAVAAAAALPFYLGHVRSGKTVNKLRDAILTRRRRRAEREFAELLRGDRSGKAAEFIAWCDGAVEGMDKDASAGNAVKGVLATLALGLGVAGWHAGQSLARRQDPLRDREKMLKALRSQMAFKAGRPIPALVPMTDPGRRSEVDPGGIIEVQSPLFDDNEDEDDVPSNADTLATSYPGLDLTKLSEWVEAVKTAAFPSLRPPERAPPVGLPAPAPVNQLGWAGRRNRMNNPEARQQFRSRSAGTLVVSPAGGNSPASYRPLLSLGVGL